MTILRSIASALLCLMMVVTATSRASIGFCLCEEVILVDDCGCDTSPNPSRCKVPTEDTGTDNCLMDISIDVDDYLAGSQGDLLKQLCSCPCFPVTPGSPDFLSPLRGSTLHNVSGKDLLSPIPPRVPLFVRHSVFRI